MRIESYRALLDLLDREGVLHQADPAARTATIPTERDGVEGALVLRWQDEDAALQIIQSLPVVVPEARRPALALAVARLNHALAFPGVDLDLDRGTLAFRLVLPLRVGVEPSEIRASFRAAVRAGAELVPTLRRAIDGTLGPEEVVDDLRRVVANPTQAGPVFPID